MSRAQELQDTGTIVAGKRAYDGQHERDTRSVIGFVEAASRVRDMPELWNIYQRTMARYGFPRVLYGFTVNRSENSFGDPDDLVVLSNHEPGYMQEFISGGLYFSAPMVNWAAQNVGAQSWRLAQQKASRGELSAQAQKVFDFNAARGVTAGYTVSLPVTTQREKAAVGLAAEPGVTQAEVEEVWALHGRVIEALTQVFHLKMLTLPHITARRPLTKRQREVLEWVGHGKTTADIATIMGLTTATIEKHLRLAREVLDVDTTAQAVLKASFQNQIYAIPR